jgi:hypothetical protein
MCQELKRAMWRPMQHTSQGLFPNIATFSLQGHFCCTSHPSPQAKIPHCNRINIPMVMECCVPKGDASRSLLLRPCELVKQSAGLRDCTPALKAKSLQIPSGPQQEGGSKEGALAGELTV